MYRMIARAANRRSGLHDSVLTIGSGCRWAAKNPSCWFCGRPPARAALDFAYQIGMAMLRAGRPSLRKITIDFLSSRGACSFTAGLRLQRSKCFDVQLPAAHRRYQYKGCWAPRTADTGPHELHVKGESRQLTCQVMTSLKGSSRFGSG